MTTVEPQTTRRLRTSYVPHTDEDRRQMLEAIGVASIEDLFVDIPAALRNPPLRLPEGMSELEILAHLERLADRNMPLDRIPSFLGAGAYRHFIPSAVWQLVSRSEFYTSYTPYQPEVSQGTLQAMYEFQSFVALLTGMDVANASVYDGASGLAEAALMAVRITGRPRVAVAASVHPDYLRTVETYLVPQGIAVERFDPASPPEAQELACLAIQQPSFEGFLVPVDRVGDAARAGGALFVVSVDALSLGLLRPPGAYGADIVVGEAQSCGVPLQFGGPYVGIFACKQKYIRQLPGRLVGATVDHEGRRGYVLTLQAREQHIRRERATSNICTSQGLMALAATIYLALLGKEGVREVAELCYHKAHYAASLLTSIPGVTLARPEPFWCEFTLQLPLSPTEVNRRLLERGIIGGLDISDRIPNGWLVCVTEVNSREEIERLAAETRAIVEGR
ncbi:MAG: aminomethyl-transferring glycine dehydrogenase subunit GcvPA [Chloroflexota bacterium]|nr:aminomethyl-transferring glycine dehydrogenase subunit GcvPA [Dehalococcoidia bacterium]MDW8255057.1 aminomethyl-transferring glycine dehydrogenase subunit GcvPA [Chloroflexota bacterium]